MSKFAPDNDQGLHAYVVTTSGWGRSYDRIEYAVSIRDAKAKWGWTRELHTFKKVRRALAGDIATVADQS